MADVSHNPVSQSSSRLLQRLASSGKGPTDTHEIGVTEILMPD